MKKKISIGILKNKLNQFYVIEKIIKNLNLKILEFPGGKIKLGESPENALKRELIEEVGIFPIKYRIFKTIIFSYFHNEHILYFYLVTHWKSIILSKLIDSGVWMCSQDLDASYFWPANNLVISTIKQFF